MKSRGRRHLAVACGVGGVASLALAVELLRGETSPTAARLALAALSSSAALGLFASMGALASRQPVWRALGTERGGLSWGRTLLLVAGTLGVSHVLDELLRLANLRDSASLQRIDTALGDATGGAVLLAVVGIGLAPGLAEELLFRGLLLRAVARRAGVVVGVVVAAVLFGLLHLDPVHAFATGLLGLYLGAVAVASGSTRAAIGGHAANNVAAVLIGASPLGAAGASSVPLAIAAVAVVAALIVLAGAFRPDSLQGDG